MGRIIFFRDGSNYIARVLTISQINAVMNKQRSLPEFCGFYCEHREGKDKPYKQVKLKQLRQLLSKN